MNKKLTKIWWVGVCVAALNVIVFWYCGFRGEQNAWIPLAVAGVSAWIALGALGLRTWRRHNCSFD